MSGQNVTQGLQTYTVSLEEVAARRGVGADFLSGRSYLAVAKECKVVGLWKSREKRYVCTTYVVVSGDMTESCLFKERR
jgi:hypothetical protein